MQADESNFDPDSDNETRTTNISMKTETKPIITQGSSGLLLLAAAAEQKQKDEEGKFIFFINQILKNSIIEESFHHPFQSPPMDISYLSNCLSPQSALATQFSQSIAFSPPSDDLASHLRRHGYQSNQSIISNSPTTNIILSLTSNPNRFDFFHHHQQQRHDQQTIVTTSTASSSSNTPSSTHVLCR
jgi:hypothetical protein